MEKNELDKIVKLRKYLIAYYETLDGGTNTSTAITLQRDVAFTLETAIASLDELLGTYVSFS